LSDICPIKNSLRKGDVLPPLHFNVALEYAVSRVQVNQDGFRLKGIHFLFMLIMLLYGTEAYIQKNTDALLFSTRRVD